MSLRPSIGDPNILTKKIAPNPKYKDIEHAVETGSSLSKQLKRIEEKKRDYKFSDNEHFLRIKPSTLARLLFEASIDRDLEPEGSAVAPQVISRPTSSADIHGRPRSPGKQLAGGQHEAPLSSTSSSSFNSFTSSTSFGKQAHDANIGGASSGGSAHHHRWREESMPSTPSDTLTRELVLRTHTMRFVEASGDAINQSNAGAMVMSNGNSNNNNNNSSNSGHSNDIASSASASASTAHPSSAQWQDHYALQERAPSSMAEFLVGGLAMASPSPDDENTSQYHRQGSSSGASSNFATSAYAPFYTDTDKLQQGGSASSSEQDNRDRLPFVLLDVREREDFLKWHLAGARWFPHSSLARGLDRLFPDIHYYKNKEGKLIVVYDEDERLATVVAQQLCERAIDNIYVLSGGLNVFARSIQGAIVGEIPAGVFPSNPSRPASRRSISTTPASLQRASSSNSTTSSNSRLGSINTSSSSSSKIASMSTSGAPRRSSSSVIAHPSSGQRAAEPSSIPAATSSVSRAPSALPIKSSFDRDVLEKSLRSLSPTTDTMSLASGMSTSTSKLSSISRTSASNANAAARRPSYPSSQPRRVGQNNVATSTR